MHYLKIDGDWVSVFAVCQAHQQLESDFNVDGWVRERPSNQRRMASTGVQLSRMQYHSPYQWVDICAEREDGDDPDDEDVRFIYLSNVLKWKLPIDDEMADAIRRTFTEDALAPFADQLVGKGGV